MSNSHYTDEVCPRCKGAGRIEMLEHCPLCSRKSNQPVRVQLSRAAGWRLPPNTVVVSRPGRWGNPYKAKECSNGAEGAVQCFRVLVESEDETIAEIKQELRGKNLACWCKLGQPCHADVLLEIANAQD